jgi:hypothetical protein
MAMTVHSTVFWVVTSYSSESDWCFGGIYRLHFQFFSDLNSLKLNVFDLKVKDAIFSFQILKFDINYEGRGNRQITYACLLGDKLEVLSLSRLST